MSAKAGVKPASTEKKTKYTLTSLPHDVLLHLLDQLTPSQIAAYSELSRSTALSASDPYIWASVARRHLGIAPPHTNSLSAAAVSRLATALSCRWWLATGTFVQDVAVHFRKGFTEVRARGGIEVPVAKDHSETCYVFGGRHKDSSVPVAVPSVSMDFSLDPAGPFPMDGMRIRLVHASEPVWEDPMITEVPAEASTESLPPMAELSLGLGLFEGSDSDVPSPPADRARIRVRLNNSTVIESTAPDPDVFSVMDVCIGPELLQTRPRMNTLIVEYDRSSTAAYWLKEVSLTPAILPVAPISPESLVFGVQSAKKNAVITAESDAESVEIPAEGTFRHGHRENIRPNHGSDGPRTPPHPTRRGHRLQTARYHLVDAQPGGKTHRGGKHQKQGKKPKHVYHHNGHHRSPRGSSPNSPSRSRSSH